MSNRLKINLILLAGMVLPPLSYLLMSFDMGMAIAEVPVLGYVYPSLPFAFLQLLLCYNFRGRFSRFIRLLPLILVGPFYLLGWYWIFTVSGAGGIPAILLITFTTLPMLGTLLGWIVWGWLRFWERRDRL